jgi:ABC-2 type transport system permease protein
MPVYDQGYQHWNGQLTGHAWRWLAIARHGIRNLLKGWYVRRLIFLAWMPALTLVSILALWGMVEQGVSGIEKWLPWFLSPLVGMTDLHTCRQAVWTIAFSFFFMTELYFIMLIVTLAGPSLISSDLRFNALPLYFSRPLTRFDYFLGKLGMIASIVAIVAVIPAVVAYLLGVCFSLDLSVVRDTWQLLPQSIAYGMIIVFSAGTLVLAMSSLSRRSLYVGLAWISIWLVSAAMSLSLDLLHKWSIARGIQEVKLREDSSEPDQPTHFRRRGRFVRPNDPALLEALAVSAKTNWRPLFSYPANLERLGDVVLNTDAAWVKIAHVLHTAQPSSTMMFNVAPWDTSDAGPFNEREYADQWAFQYPWTWSAAILAGLFVLSISILSIRVKSLDRLR